MRAELQNACIALATLALAPPMNSSSESPQLVKTLQELTAAAKKEPELTTKDGEAIFLPIHALLQYDKLSTGATERVFSLLGLILQRSWQNSLSDKRASELLLVVTFLMCPSPDPARWLAEPSEFRSAGLRCLKSLFEAAIGSNVVPAVDKPATVMAYTLAVQGLIVGDECVAPSLELIEVILSFWDKKQAIQVLPQTASYTSRLVLNRGLPRRANLNDRIVALRVFSLVAAKCFSNSEKEKSISIQFNGADWKESALKNLEPIIDRMVTDLPQWTQPPLIAAALDFAIEMKSTDEFLKPALRALLWIAGQEINEASAESAKKLIASIKDMDSVIEHLTGELAGVLTSPDEGKPIVLLTELTQAFNCVATPAVARLILTSLEEAIPLALPQSKSKVQKTHPSRFELQLPDNTNISPTLSSFGLREQLSPGVERAVSRLIKQLGKLQGELVLQRIVSVLQMKDEVTPLRSLLLLWISGEVIDGLRGQNENTPNSDTVHEIAEYCWDNLNLGISLSSETTPVHTALSAHVLGKVALLDGASFREFYIVDAIWPLVATLGSEHEVVRTTAQRVLMEVASASGSSGVSDLIVTSADYIVDGISHQLTTLDISPSTISALAAVIWIGGQRVIPYVDDLIATLFVILDHYHAYHQIILRTFSVFRSLIRAIKIIPPQICATSARSGPQLTSLESLEAALEPAKNVELDPIDLDEKIQELDEQDENIWKKFHSEAKDDSKDEGDSDDEPLGSEAGSEADDLDGGDAPEVVWDCAISPPVYEMLEKIVLYADKLATHAEMDVRMTIIVLIGQAAPLLAMNEARFLPVVHKIWPTIVARLNDVEAPIVESAALTLAAIVAGAGDFVAQRFSDLWPQLRDRVGRMAERQWPQFSRERRLLISIEKLVESAVRHSRLSFETIESVLVTFRPALLRNDLPELRTILESQAGDICWLVLLTTPTKPHLTSLDTIRPIY